MFSRMHIRISVLIVVFMAETLWACGPSFPNSYLAGGGEALLLQPPGLSFEEEIRRIDIEIDAPVVCSSKRSATNRNSVIEIDIAELRQALEPVIADSNQLEQTVTGYGQLRKNIEDYYHGREGYARNHGKGDGTMPKPELFFSPEEIPTLVPKEFALYLEGVFCYRTNQLDKAVQLWQDLLDLPADERYYRSTWAAYMIGQRHHREHYKQEGYLEKARQMYRQVRQYVQDGFADSLDLAAVSYGDEAATWLVENQYEKAIQLYLVQTLTKNTTAVPSLKQVCYGVFNRHNQIDMVSLVKNRMIREVLLAYAITCPKNEKYNAFISNEDGKRKFITCQPLLLDAIEQAELFGIENADRFAMAAYRAGDYERAKRWLDVADIDSLISRRIRAKLYLRDGNVEEAAKDLAFVARQTDPDHLRYYDDHSRLDNSNKLHSELGTLYVSQKMFVQSLDVLLKGGNWIDSAYIAERVLTSEELQAYVDANWPASILEQRSDEDGFGEEGLKAMKIRYLLARRLSRLGLYEKAQPYYPNTQKELLEAFEMFTKALKKANDHALSQTERADAFWTAAWLTRHKGMELFGFELDPDWSMFGGNYSPKRRLEIREELSEKKVINAPSSDEIERARREVAQPDKRFHYRYMASDFAWEAAALMPNEDDELARRLCLAGSWHRDQDNEHADVFYKSLVLRCGTTVLGKKANRIRWFPKIADTLKAESVIKPASEGSGLSQ